MTATKTAKARDMRRAAAEIVAWVRAGNAVEILADNGRVVGHMVPVGAVTGLTFERATDGWAPAAPRHTVPLEPGQEMTGEDMAEIGRAIWGRVWWHPMSAAIGLSSSAVKGLWRKPGSLPRVVARRVKEEAGKAGIALIRR